MYTSIKGNRISSTFGVPSRLPPTARTRGMLSPGPCCSFKHIQPIPRSSVPKLYIMLVERTDGCAVRRNKSKSRGKVRFHVLTSKT